MRRCAGVVAAVLAALALAGFTTEVASATHVTFYSGTMTQNYHNFGRCYYSIASECSGWNYWDWTDALVNSTT